MRPSPDHERATLEIYGYGSTTFRKEARERALDRQEPGRKQHWTCSSTVRPKSIAPAHTCLSHVDSKRVQSQSRALVAFAGSACVFRLALLG